jgi:DNA (cytosine-5)-methyltransferase 1
MTDHRPLRVADLFCGPGGLSEGMRLGGCEIVYGLDKAKDAVTSFQANHPKAVAVVGDAGDLKIDDIPPFDILVGGPPCVNFSKSKGGRANILEGLRLVQLFLRVVYEREPKYWIMENVPQIAMHLPAEIPLKWIGIDRKGALHIPVRHEFNCADYGVPQNRKRYLIGNYPIPEPTHEKPEDSLFAAFSEKLLWRNLAEILASLGQPYCQAGGKIVDPNYGFEIDAGSLADHYHEVDLTDREAESIRAAKTDHPFMGFMPFPDETNRPARTVVATQLGRETLVLETTKGRVRRASVRECATIQTFPIDYHFYGASINSRYRQAGDAVPPLIVKQIAEKIIASEGCARATASGKREEREPPPPAVLKKRKISNAPLPISKRFRKIIPGKEVRGSRIDWDNQGSDKTLHPTYDCYHIVRWASRLHLGEGASAEREAIVTVENGIDLLLPLLKRKPEMIDRLLQLAERLDEDLPKIVPDATTLQAIYTRRHQGGTTPDKLALRISNAVDEFFPREEFAEKYTMAERLFGIEMPKKGLRVRIAVGGLAAAYLSELANYGTLWIEENDSLVFRPGNAKPRRNAQSRSIRELLPRCEERLAAHQVQPFG